MCIAAAGAPVASEEVRALVARLEGVLRREEERRALQTSVLAQVEALRKQLEPLERVRSSLLRLLLVLLRSDVTNSALRRKRLLSEVHCGFCSFL